MQKTHTMETTQMPSVKSAAFVDNFLFGGAEA